MLGLSSFELVAAQANKIVIAHRGASGYLPEHSMAAKALAHNMNVDYIEQDVVMTKDDKLVVLHDHYLDRVTNVATKFPNRHRADGRYYVIDFTLAEIKSLSMTEGFSITDNKQVANYPDRFPLWQSSFNVHTLAEEIELIQGLNKTMNKNVGIYPEIKSPAFHLHEGKDISLAVLNTLKRYGYTARTSNVFLQSFDANDLKRIKHTLLPHLNMDIKLVQLIAKTDWQETIVYKGNDKTPYNFDWMLLPESMTKIAEYADGIGPWKPMLVDDFNSPKKPQPNGLIKAAHKAGLVVHPYTFRADKGRIPDFAASFNDLVNFYLFELNVDGIFTDFPDKAVKVIQRSIER